MRIAVVTTSYPEHEGDPSGHFVHEEVLDLERQGHEVTVVTPRAGGAFGWPGVASRMRESPLRLFEAGAWLARAGVAVGRRRYDRVIAHWAVPAAFPLGLAARGAALEVVSHGGDVRLLRAAPARARRAVVRAIVRRAERWRFVSEALLADLETALEPEDARALRTIARVAPSPLGILDVSADVRAKRDALGGKRLYVTAGRLVASKQVHRVIDYVASERARGASVLVVLGDGPCRRELESVARAWQIDVRFLGKTTRREALGWIGAADELVHASRAEGLSTVVREAEHLGVPVTRL